MGKNMGCGIGMLGVPTSGRRVFRTSIFIVSGRNEINYPSASPQNPRCSGRQIKVYGSDFWGFLCERNSLFLSKGLHKKQIREYKQKTPLKKYTSSFVPSSKNTLVHGCITPTNRLKKLPKAHIIPADHPAGVNLLEKQSKTIQHKYVQKKKEKTPLLRPHALSTR